MRNWLSGVRGTVAMILTWTVGWGLGFGGLAEIMDPSGKILDVWPTVMAIPGFVGGAVFSALLRMAEGRRSFDEVSFARFTTWGAVTGLVLGVLAVVTGFPGEFSFPRAALIGIAVAIALGAVAGFGSGVFFRLLGKRQTPAVARPQA